MYTCQHYREKDKRYSKLAQFVMSKRGHRLFLVYVLQVVVYHSVGTKYVTGTLSQFIAVPFPAIALTKTKSQVILCLSFSPGMTRN